MQQNYQTFIIMKRLVFFLSAFVVSATTGFAASPQLTYNGVQLPWNTEFTRTYLGDLKSSAGLVEISGIACSRVTPGYIWMESDDYKDCIIATDEQGTTRRQLIQFSSTISRNDWEDMCGGVYNGTNYLFIGLFGDNNASKGNYQILYFEEPAITGGTKTVTPNIIKFQYPNGIYHNAEAMMYDNVEQTIYIITKVYYDVCQVFKLPMSLTYGDNLQTLTYVCDLGVKSDIGVGTTADGDKAYKGFHLVTAADISPDGQYVLIKNHNNTAGDLNEEYSWTLMWKRQGEESISQTLLRQPQPIGCYEQEWQGEAICWLDNTTFYTVSDDEGEPPMYKYVRPDPSGNTDPDPDPQPGTEKLIAINGDFSDWSDLDGLAHAEGTTGLYDMRWYANETDIYFYLEFDEAVGPIDILLSTDNDASTGHNGWMFSNSAAEYLIEGEVENYNWASLFTFDNAQSQESWAGFVETDTQDFLIASDTIPLANGHKALEGKIVQAKLNPIVVLKVGVFVSDTGWAEIGWLPAGTSPLLEVPIYHPVATGVDIVNGQKSIVDSRKILRNGQLFIIRDGKTYNAQGTLVK